MNYPENNNKQIVLHYVCGEGEVVNVAAAVHTIRMYPGMLIDQSYLISHIEMIKI